MLKSILKWLPGILFNVLVLATIWVCGLRIGISHGEIFLLLAAWTFAKHLRGNPMHYKMWQKCFLASVLVFLSLFVVVKTDFLLAIILVVFAARILNDSADVRDVFMFAWTSRGDSKYQKELDYVRANPDSPELLRFQERLARDSDEHAHEVYTCVFVEGLSWAVTADKLQMDTRRINDVVKSVALALRLYCDL